MFTKLFGYESRTKRLLKKVRGTALHDFLSVPLPDKDTCLADLPILSVDFETTGLNAINDKLLSVGFVEMNKRQIKLCSCYHQIVNAKRNLHANNVIIHEITDQQQSQGKPLRVVVEDLLKALAGKVMLVHFARIEQQFLQQACLELYGVSPPLLIIDTLAVEKRKLEKMGVSCDPQLFRLTALRQKYGLPEHFGHNALNDAIATAELFLAQKHKGKTKLKDLL